MPPKIPHYHKFKKKYCQKVPMEWELFEISRCLRLIKQRKQIFSSMTKFYPLGTLGGLSRCLSPREI